MKTPIYPIQFRYEPTIKPGESPRMTVRGSMEQDNISEFRRKLRVHQLRTALDDLVDASSAVTPRRRLRRVWDHNKGEIVCLVIVAFTLATLWSWLAWASQQQ